MTNKTIKKTKNIKTRIFFYSTEIKKKEIKKWKLKLKKPKGNNPRKQKF
jgi:hypothetical protein